MCARPVGESARPLKAGNHRVLDKRIQLFARNSTANVFEKTETDIRRNLDLDQVASGAIDPRGNAFLL